MLRSTQATFLIGKEANRDINKATSFSIIKEEKATMLLFPAREEQTLNIPVPNPISPEPLQVRTGHGSSFQEL